MSEQSFCKMVLKKANIKPTFTGQYYYLLLRWNSFCTKQRKVNLVKTLVHRALMICSKSKLHAELEKLKCFFAVNPHIVYSTRRALPFIQKDCVPTNQKSSVIYEFTCQCDSGYVGRTTQRLGDMIKQHVPSNIRNKTAPQREQPPRSCRSRNTV